MQEDIQYSNNIQPICLPPYEWDNKVLEEGMIAGWGLSERSDRINIEEVLRKTKINAPPTNEECFLRYSELVPLSSWRTFCAGGDYQGPCSGDSGKYLNPVVKSYRNYVSKLVRKFN